MPVTGSAETNLNFFESEIEWIGQKIDQNG